MTNTSGPVVRGRARAPLLVLLFAATACVGPAVVPPIVVPATTTRLEGKVVWHDLVTADSGAAASSGSIRT